MMMAGNTSHDLCWYSGHFQTFTQAISRQTAKARRRKKNRKPAEGRGSHICLAAAWSLPQPPGHTGGKAGFFWAGWLKAPAGMHDSLIGMKAGDCTRLPSLPLPAAARQFVHVERGKLLDTETFLLAARTEPYLWNVGAIALFKGISGGAYAAHYHASDSSAHFSPAISSLR